MALQTLMLREGERQAPHLVAARRPASFVAAGLERTGTHPFFAARVVTSQLLARMDIDAGVGLPAHGSHSEPLRDFRLWADQNLRLAIE